MNRRRVIMGVGLAAVAGISALAAPSFFARSRNEGKVTLKSRILDNEDSFKKMEEFPHSGYIDKITTRLMEEYFKIGMSYDECIKILEENDLKVDRIYTDVPDYKIRDKRVYFSPSIASIINLPTWNPLLNFSYRLILRFHNAILDEISASRVGTGP